jgi:prolyl oligopeptidase
VKIIFGVILVGLSCWFPLSASAAAAAPPAQATSPASRQLAQIIENTWQRDLKSSPLEATYLGDTRYNDQWPEATPAAFERDHKADSETLKALAGIKRAALSGKDQLNFDLFKGEMESRLARYPFKPWSYQMTMREGPQTLNEVAEIMPFDTAADYEIWLKRLRALPRYLDQYIALLRTAAAEGRTQPRSLMQRALPTLESQAGATAESSPFFDRFKRMPEKLASADRERLAAEAKRVIGNDVIPAYKRFAVFFRDEYLPRCRETVGIWDTPDGLAYYANRAKSHTTTSLTPEEIHQIGLAEVTRIRGEMQQVMDKLGFTGTRQQFFEKLRTDPQFYFTNPDDLFRAYVYTTKMIEPELPKLFGKLYRTPIGLKPIPMTSAPNTTTAYYSGPSIDGKRAGYFYTNLYKPEVRPKYEIEVLTVHEAIPGHHLQIALAQEQTDLPKFRRFAGYTAYIEGWALYSERLGFELGLYKDPYSHFGQLTYDMWRAVRLVVDTGIHVKKWTRQQAIDYFKDNAAKTETDIINEIDRYIGWPGQALAYKIGQMKILELRAKAEKTLGPKFDIRAFHDMVLESGAIPLDVLEGRVNDWINRQRT